MGTQQVSIFLFFIFSRFVFPEKSNFSGCLSSECLPLWNLGYVICRLPHSTLPVPLLWAAFSFTCTTSCSSSISCHKSWTRPSTETRIRSSAQISTHKISATAPTTVPIPFFFTEAAAISSWQSLLVDTMSLAESKFPILHRPPYSQGSPHSSVADMNVPPALMQALLSQQHFSILASLGKQSNQQEQQQQQQLQASYPQPSLSSQLQQRHSKHSCKLI